jgi:molecular chaperone DnaK
MLERACQSVGIDLGTTYSALAWLDSQLKPQIVHDSSGQPIVPSVIYFDDQEIIVGEFALQQARLHADRVAQFIKIHMGDQWRRTYQGHEYTPETLSALILKYLIHEAEPQIGPIPSAVITVPAYFTEKRRRATEQAGQIAGLDVIGTLNEPMAATLAYGLYREHREQKVLVYDLGGGTFDVTIVSISPDEIVELATAGNRQLGGRDWDQCLIDFVASEFQKKHGADPRTEPQAAQDLQLICENAKRQLSVRARTGLRLQACGQNFTLDVARDRFEQITAHLLQQTKLTAEMALEDAELDWSDLSRVVLVGGSTQMPAVRQMLERTTGRIPESSVSPVLAVAMGAAIYAHMVECGTDVQTIYRNPALEHDPEPSSQVQTQSERSGEVSTAVPGAQGVRMGTSPLQEGGSFGRYRILGKLGHGAMGEVFLADDTQLDRQVALKIPRFDAGDDLEEALDRFYREARAAAKLSHPNICAVYDVGEISGLDHISMAFIDGWPLSRFSRSPKPQPEREVVKVMLRLARALHHAHSHGVIHRDLKPANIMIDRRGEPVIMDFGLARRVSRDEARVTLKGTILGTPAYMSPEQAQGQTDAIGPQSDVFSLGIIFYELLTGLLPFRGDIINTLHGIVHENPKPPTEVRRGLDPRIEAICLKMMAKRLEDRYASMDEVAEALTGCLMIARRDAGPRDQAVDRIGTVEISHAGSPGEPPPFSSHPHSPASGPGSAPTQATPRPAGNPDDSGPGVLETSDMSRPPLRFVTAHGVGVRVKAGDAWKNSVLIHKNTQVPAQATKRYYTATRTGANTFIRIEITQGDSEDLGLVEVLGTGVIQGFPQDEPPGQPVDVTMQFDQKSRLHVTAVYANTGQVMQMTIQVPAQLSEEQVRRERDFIQQASLLSVPADTSELD